jgi:DNA-binding MarR family transcriptional regulator
MPMTRAKRIAAVAQGKTVPAQVTRRHRHLVRFTHIFSSAVRELLEVKLIGEVTRAPLSLSQFHLLKAVAMNGYFYSGELASFLGVSAPAGTKTIDKLERLGFVIRMPSRCDRRATILAASAKGRRLVERYEEHKTRSLLPVMERFSADELRTFARLLERFTLSLIELQESGSGLCLYCAAYCIKKCPVGRMRGGCPFEKLYEAQSKRSSTDAFV